MAWGSNSDGQLGVGTTTLGDTAHNPLSVELPNGLLAVDVAAGDKHSIVQTVADGPAGPFEGLACMKRQYHTRRVALPDSCSMPTTRATMHLFSNILLYSNACNLRICVCSLLLEHAG